jgi:hypothetical protein
MLVLATPSLGQARSSRTMDVRVLSVLSGYSQTATGVKMTDRLFNLVPQFGKPKGAAVGTDTGTMRLRPDRRTADFTGVARLPGGSIKVKGVIKLGITPTTLTIAGGTGRFANARGMVVVRTLDANGRASNIFHLTLG